MRKSQARRRLLSTAIVSFLFYAHFELTLNANIHTTVESTTTKNIITALPPIHSQKWFNGTRLANIEEDPAYVQELILGDAAFILKQTFAFKESAFVNWDISKRYVGSFGVDSLTSPSHVTILLQ